MEAGAGRRQIPALVLIVRQAPSSVLMNWLDGASRDWGLTVAGAELERAANPHGRPLPGRSTAASRSRPPPGRHPDDPARPSRRGLLLALACSVAALLAALSLPARWLLLAAPQGGIVSADAGGTIWNGSAWIALGPPARAAAAGLQWQWHWRTLEMELRHPGCKARCG